MAKLALSGDASGSGHPPDPVFAVWLKPAQAPHRNIQRQANEEYRRMDASRGHGFRRSFRIAERITHSV
jgi:hypothetical protein